MDYSKEVLHAINTKVGPLLVKTTTKYIDFERISIDGEDIIATRLDMYRLWLVYSYLYDYVNDTSEESLDKLSKILSEAGKIATTSSASSYTTIADTILDNGNGGSGVLYAGIGLEGDSYNTYTDEVWSLDDLLASPTDTIVTPSSII